MNSTSDRKWFRKVRFSMAFLWLAVPNRFICIKIQSRLMGNFGFSACVPWTIRADESLCFVCKKAEDDLYHFLFVCPYFRQNFDSLWLNLDVKASHSSPTDGSQISAFIKNLDQDSKALLLLGCLPLPFDSMTFRPGFH